MYETERIKMVKAMEYICRQINDETILLDDWLINGVADGDIRCGDLSAENKYRVLDYYIEDEHFAELMSEFLYCMKKAEKDGGLYCDGVVSAD